MATLSWIVSVLLGLALSASTAGMTVSGYKVVVRTVVQDDLSLSRRYEFHVALDLAATLDFEKALLREAGYRLIEEREGDTYRLLAHRVYLADSSSLAFASDCFSSIEVQRSKGGFIYSEDFNTNFLIQKIDQSELEQDYAMAKVLMSDLTFQFVAVLPYQITESNGGDFFQDSVSWSYDVETLFNHQILSMKAYSELHDPGDGERLMFGMAASILLLSVLLLVKLLVSSRPAQAKTQN